MAGRNARSVLKDLDKALQQVNWKGVPSDISHLCDPDHMEAFKKLGNNESVISSWIVQEVTTRINSALEYKICSLGCQDGKLDQMVLSKLAKNHPKVKFQYTGIEADEQVCETLEEQLTGSIPNVETTIVTLDYDEITKDDISEQFDLILMASCTYFAPSLEPMLKGAIELLKPSGELVIVSSSKQSIDELITRFWFHQRKHDLNTTEILAATLAKLGIKHKISKETVTFDLSEGLKEKFASPPSQMILDHLVFTHLEDYPPEISKLCVEYLEALAEHKPNGKQVVTSLSDMIVITK